jgi:hypothetical protein
LKSSKSELLQFLEHDTREIHATVMPDFFLDRIVSLERDAPDFSAIVADITKRKGGSIDGLKQTEMRGGNAANTASALAALGARITPIICSDRLGLQFIKLTLRSNMIDLSHVKSLDKPSITTALEFQSEGKRDNVMLRDVGSLADFGPDDLDSHDFDAIEQADYGEYFVHRLGHGVGLDIHEAPSLNPEGKETLKTGNVVTDEPGIYIVDYGGVRIEDTVLVQDNNAERLTKAASNW